MSGIENETIDEAVAVLSTVIGLGAPASRQEVAAAELRLDYQIPRDLREFYLRANGTVDHTPADKGWTRLWAIEEWRAVKRLELGQLYAEIDDSTVIADYSIECWWYAISRDGSVYIVDGLRSARVVAEGFRDFVKMLVTDDKGLYPTF